MTIETNTLLSSALNYITNGFSVIPLKPGGKIPLTAHGLKDATMTQLGVKEYWTRWPDANIGIITHGFIVIDFDAKNDGLTSKDQLIARYGQFPQTRVHKTGGGGEHWIYKAPESADIRGGAGKYGYPGVDIRANGGYIVAPPSFHASGNRYQVINDSPIAPAPSWLVELVLAKQIGIYNSRNNQNGEVMAIPDGQRDDVMTSMAGSMRRAGMCEEAIEAALSKVNEIQCNPPKLGAPQRIAHSIARYEPSAPVVASSYNLTDTGNAELLVSLFGDRIRYDHKHTRWLIWNGNIWQPDNTGEIYRLAIEATRERYRRATTVHDLPERANVSRWAIASENRGRMEAAVTIAQNLPPIADSGDGWDTDKWLLGCENGVLDLRTGQLRQGNQIDRITMTTGITFDPDATCSRWEQFLTEIFNNDKSLIDWMWRFMGYAITGDTSEQVILVGYGTGANGKGKFNHALRQAMGDYAYDAPFSTFELTHASSVPNDLAALERRRFVTSSETNDGTRLNEARMKAISGEDPITARYLHKEFFTYQPACKICLFVNHKPRVEDDSYGFWRRVRLVPFTRQFAGSNDDKQLGKKLDAEAAGILAWLVRGCLEVQRRGLIDIPNAITTATEEYKVESDPLTQFISEACVEVPTAITRSSELYKAYCSWADDLSLRGRERLTINSFGRRMKDRYEKIVQRDGTYYQGIGLKSCGGFNQTVVDFKPETPKFQVASQCSSSHKENIENPPQSTTSTTEASDIRSNPTIDYDDRVFTLLGMPIEDALAIWRRQGAPIIHLGEGQNCHDLELLLKNNDLPDYQLQAVEAWLDQNK